MVAESPQLGQVWGNVLRKKLRCVDENSFKLCFDFEA